MAVAEQKLSPEEKLLKVIQGGGEAEKPPTPEEKMLSAVKPAVAAAPAPKPVPAKPPESAKPAATPAPVAKPVSAAPPAAAIPRSATQAEPPRKVVEAQPAEPVKKAEPRKEEKKGPHPKAAAAAPEEKPFDKAQDKPKLKVLKPEPATEGKEPSAKPVIGAPESGVIGAAGPVAVAGKGRSGRKFTMGVVNQGLAAAVLLVLALTGYEIWAAVHEASSTAKIPPGQKPPNGVAAEPAKPDNQPPLASIVDPWKDKDIFSSVGGELIKRPDDKTQPTQSIPEVAARLKLMAFSKAPEGQAKAVLWDATEARMFIVRVGEKILVGEQRLEVIQIKDDQVVLSNGRDNISLK